MPHSNEDGSDGYRDAPCQIEPGSTAQPSGGPNESVFTDGGWGRLDRIFTALGRSRRRYVLYYLARCEPATIDEIARHVAAWETGRSPTELAEESEPVNTIALSLYHEHLARLDDLGFVECDLRNGDVRFRECPELLLEIIELCRSRELPNPPFERN